MRLLLLISIVSCSCAQVGGQIVAFVPDEPVPAFVVPNLGQPRAFSADDYIDLDFDGEDDFLFASRTIGGPGSSTLFAESGFILYSGNAEAVRLSEGDLISDNEDGLWATSAVLNGFEVREGQPAEPFGNFLHETGYIGIQLEIEGQLHFGWIHYAGGQYGGNILGWAYETTSNVPIMAGAIPEPSSYALIALGGILVSFMHRLSRLRR